MSNLESQNLHDMWESKKYFTVSRELHTIYGLFDVEHFIYRYMGLFSTETAYR